MQMQNEENKKSLSIAERSKIFIDSRALFIRSIVIKINGLISSFFVSYILGPEKLGILKLIDVIPSLAKYLNFGYDTFLLRNVGRIRNENIINNNKLYRVSRAGSLIFSTILILLIMPIFFIIHPKEYYGYIAIAGIAALAFVFSRNFTNNVQIIEDFKFIGKYEIIASFIQLLIIIMLTWILFIYAPLIAMLSSYLILTFAMFARSPIPLKFNFSSKEHLKQLKITLPLALATFLLGLEVILERYVIGLKLSQEILGNYFLILMIYGAFVTLLNNVLRASSVKIYQKSNTINQAKDIFPFLLETTISLALAMLVLSIIAVEVFNIFLPNIFSEFTYFLENIHAIVLLAVLTSTQVLFVHSLTSVALNQQNIIILARLLSIGIFFNYIFFNPKLSFEYLLLLKAICIFIFGCIALFSYFKSIKIFKKNLFISIILLIIPITLSLIFFLEHGNPLIKFVIFFFSIGLLMCWLKFNNVVLKHIN